MEYSHSPSFRILASPGDEVLRETFEKEFRRSLFSTSISLAIFARLRASEGEGASNGERPWARLANFLDEVNDDLRESSPYGDRIIGWVFILTMVAENLDLEELDPDFHFLLSLFVQACLLIELEQTRKLPSADALANRDASRARIQASLDFIVVELADRRRSERKGGSRTEAA